MKNWSRFIGLGLSAILLTACGGGGGGDGVSPSGCQDCPPPSISRQELQNALFAYYNWTGAVNRVHTFTISEQSGACAQIQSSSLTTTVISGGSNQIQLNLLTASPSDRGACFDAVLPEWGRDGGSDRATISNSYTIVDGFITALTRSVGVRANGNFDFLWANYADWPIGSATAPGSSVEIRNVNGGGGGGVGNSNQRRGANNVSYSVSGNLLTIRTIVTADAENSFGAGTNSSAERKEIYQIYGASAPYTVDLKRVEYTAPASPNAAVLKMDVTSVTP